jgi:hypothetical protein
VTAGVAALIMSANSALAPSQVVSLLESTSVDLGAAGYDNYYGYGRVNAASAVASAAAGVPSDTQAPSVVISTPTGGSVSGIVPVSVSASDNVGVTHVDLLVNGAVLASDTTSPYSFSWDSSSLAGTTVSLVARAYDAAGNAGSSTPISVSVATPRMTDTTPPTVSITVPSGGSVSGVVTVSVSASDNVGVASVQLLVNGAVLATDTSSPYNFSWDSSSLAGTSATLTARAYDAAGNFATSAPSTVSVISNTPTSGVDSTPPTVQITGVTNGQQVNGMVTVGAVASDNVAVSSVTLSIDGATMVTSNASTVSYKWNARKAGSGSHTITVVARDTSGNQSTHAIQVSK